MASGRGRRCQSMNRFRKLKKPVNTREKMDLRMESIPHEGWEAYPLPFRGHGSAGISR